MYPAFTLSACVVCTKCWVQCITGHFLYIVPCLFVSVAALLNYILLFLLQRICFTEGLFYGLCLPICSRIFFLLPWTNLLSYSQCCVSLYKWLPAFVLMKAGPDELSAQMFEQNTTSNI